MSDLRRRTRHLKWVVIGLAILSTSAFLKQVVQTAPDRSVGRRAEPGRLVRPSRSAGIGGERASAAKLTALRPGDWRSPTAAPRDVAAPPPDATKTESGLAFKILNKGTGDAKPGAENHVKVHYSGWTTDGKLIDSSVVRGKPTEFPVSAVIKGWSEGLQLMVAGEKRRFWIPADLAYGDKHPTAPGMLVFDVELLEIK
jgi:hypothetical protein